MSCAKMAEPIELPFGMLSCGDPRNHVLDRDTQPPWEGLIIREKDMQGHA